MEPSDIVQIHEGWQNIVGLLGFLAFIAVVIREVLRR